MLSNAKIGQIVFLENNNDPYVITSLNNGSVYFPIEIVNLNTKIIEFVSTSGSVIGKTNVAVIIKNTNINTNNHPDLFIQKENFREGWYLDSLFNLRDIKAFEDGLVTYCANHTVSYTQKLNSLKRIVGNSMKLNKGY